MAASLGSRNPRYDHNRDGVVNHTDVEYLVFDILQTTLGDANLDGIFNSNDFIYVFQIGEYEDAIPNNSGWADGDWNCDREFTSEDIVAAFQLGGYVAEARPQRVESRLTPGWAVAAMDLPAPVAAIEAESDSPLALEPVAAPCAAA